MAPFLLSDDCTQRIKAKNPYHQMMKPIRTMAESTRCLISVNMMYLLVVVG